MRRVRSSSIGHTEANLLVSNVTEFTGRKHRRSVFYLLPLFIYAAIPENDIWIAALCRQHHLALASRDGHFDKVRGLKRVDW